MHYVDGFVVPVKKAKLQSYRRLARKMAAVCKEYGALEYVECVAVSTRTPAAGAAPGRGPASRPR